MSVSSELPAGMWQGISSTPLAFHVPACNDQSIERALPEQIPEAARVTLARGGARVDGSYGEIKTGGPELKTGLRLLNELT